MLCQVLPFTAAGDFCREVSRSYGAKEAFSLQASPAGTWPCREWAAFVSCFLYSTLAHTTLLMSGSAIPASRYSSSTLVGLKHPVIDLHASFSTGSCLEACGDLAQTGHAYSAAEIDSAINVVLIVLALQPHLEFDNFFRRLFLVATFIFVLCMGFL